MRKILMVEDNMDHALLIKRGIEKEGCDVTHFEDGLSAVEACKKSADEEATTDLVLLDLQLPGMNGLGVLENLRKMKSFERVPVVMLTTSNRRQEIDEAYRLGASGYVVKSDDFEEFKTKLKHITDYWFQTVESPTKNGATG